jgi:hypothetical protein
MQKKLLILLIINLSRIVRTGSHFETEYLQKSIGFSLNQYLSSISPECTIFWQCFNLNLYWLERAFNFASFHIRTAIILLKNIIKRLMRNFIFSVRYDSIPYNRTIIRVVGHIFPYKPASLIYHSIEKRKSYKPIYNSFNFKLGQDSHSVQIMFGVRKEHFLD